MITCRTGVALVYAYNTHVVTLFFLHLHLTISYNIQPPT
jgi:hypothetical protein